MPQLYVVVALVLAALRAGFAGGWQTRAWKAGVDDAVRERQTVHDLVKRQERVMEAAEAHAHADAGLRAELRDSKKGSPVRSLLLLIPAFLTMSACASGPMPSTGPLLLEANLRQPCQPPVKPASGHPDHVLSAGVPTAAALRECSDRHRRIVEATAQPLPQD